MCPMNGWRQDVVITSFSASRCIDSMLKATYYFFLFYLPVLCSRIQNAIAPIRTHVVPSHAPQMIRQHLFLPQPVAGDCSSTDPVSDDTTADVYAPVLKQLIPTRKNNHMLGSQHNQCQGENTREYIDIPLPKSVLQINLQNHENNCARYNYMLPTKNNILKQHFESTECVCQTSDEKQEMSSDG